MHIDSILTLIELVISAFTLAAAVLTLRVGIKTLKADHERRKKQSTIEFYQEISNITAKLKEAIDKLFADKAINPTDPDYANNEELKLKISQYLTVMERFAVGINTGVYDLDIYMRCAGRSTIHWYDRLVQIIKDKRKDNKSHLYIDFEHMTNELRNRYDKLDKSANIIHS
ncbi:MAG: DUF4760 domain-containing protein [Oscillospiraceae bacterium]|jgi:hypothetical protein|nr:DUF4760 domain-containing protein [Oscillospiraceae bacterium]